MVGLLFLVVLSLVASRHAIFMYLLALPLAAPYLRMPSEHRRDAENRVTPTADPAESAPRAHGVGFLDWALVAVLVSGSLLYAGLAVTHPIDPSRGYPEQASRYLRAQGITRYFNEWADGGFLIFRGMNPLVDGRSEQYFPYPGRRQITMGIEYIGVWFLEADCRPFLTRNGITHLLVRQSSLLTRVLEQSSEFRAVYRDQQFTIYQYTPSAQSAALSAP